MRWIIGKVVERNAARAELAPSARWVNSVRRAAIDPLQLPDGAFAERYYRRRAQDKDTRSFVAFPSLGFVT